MTFWLAVQRFFTDFDPFLTLNSPNVLIFLAF
jgi:hypothetical protein